METQEILNYLESKIDGTLIPHEKAIVYRLEKGTNVTISNLERSHIKSTEDMKGLIDSRINLALKTAGI